MLIFSCNCLEKHDYMEKLQGYAIVYAGKYAGRNFFQIFSIKKTSMLIIVKALCQGIIFFSTRNNGGRVY